jgi:large subunit ribosomal protein L21
MYAIVEIAGQQFKVEEGKKIYVHRLEAVEGDTIQFDKVLLVEDDGKVSVGEPVVQDVIVEGHILNDKIRGDKVIVFKKKRKKGYRIKNGHRQNFTQIEILHIGAKEAPRKPRAEKKAPKAVVVTEPVEEKKPAEKKSTTRKVALKKTEVAKKKPAAAKKDEKKPAVTKKPVKKTSKKEEK